MSTIQHTKNKHQIAWHHKYNNLTLRSYNGQGSEIKVIYIGNEEIKLYLLLII